MDDPSILLACILNYTKLNIEDRFTHTLSMLMKDNSLEEALLNTLHRPIISIINLAKHQH